MAVNKDPFRYSLSKDGKPEKFKGLVQAGSTQAIKVGEICAWDETSGYWAPIDAVADHRYKLAISAEEQKSSGRAELTAIRYIDFYSLHPNDVFEFELAAARSLAVGDCFTLTASDSQKLTYSAAAFPVARNVGRGHYPQEEDTTIRNQSYALVVFNEAVSYHGWKMSFGARLGRRFISTAVDLTLTDGECYNTHILVTAAKIITLPSIESGMDVIIEGTGANAVVVSPNASDAIRLAGASLGADTDATSGGGAGDRLHLVAEAANLWNALIEDGTWS